MHGPMLQGSVRNSWKLKTSQFLHGQHTHWTCHPLSMFGMLWIGVYDSVFQFLPISSNFTQPLKRSGPTFHRPQSTTWSTLCEGDGKWWSHQILTGFRWMDYLGKGEVLTNTDLDRFVNNIWEKQAFCLHRKSLRSLSSAHEKWGQKQKCCIYIFDQCVYTGAGHIIRISSKSWFISLIPFKKWNLYNVYIHSTQTDIFQVFISFNFDDYNWQLMKTPNSVSQKIRILLKTNTKKGFLEILANWKVWTWNVWACTALNT